MVHNIRLCEIKLKDNELIDETDRVHDVGYKSWKRHVVGFDACLPWWTLANSTCAKGRAERCTFVFLASSSLLNFTTLAWLASFQSPDNEVITLDAVVIWRALHGTAGGVK